MKIEPYAFNNCISLHTLDFCKLNDIHMSGIILNDNTPSNLNIFVRDKIYNNFVDNEITINKPKIKKYSDKIQKQIDNLKNSKILQAIYHLKKGMHYYTRSTILVNFINTQITFLLTKYNIIDDEYQYFETLQNKKELIKHEQ